MPEIIPLTQEELDLRIQKNFDRLCEPYYQIDQVFAPADYDWYGDKEGRAMLAFAMHVKMTGKVVPCLPQMVSMLDEKTNEHDFFGPLAGDVIHEQQLSGHNWYMRALCEMHGIYGGTEWLRRMKGVFEGLYLPTAGHYKTYPIDRPDDGGDVSGHSGIRIGEWDLSTDIGCAFMSVDGLAHYYVITRDARALDLLTEMITVFTSIDKVALQAQTHCSLTATRGMLRLYEVTGDSFFLRSAAAVWRTYIESGMTLTYQNYNWWGKGNTWTEPCAIVDSMIVALHLYEITGEDQLLTWARRIWHNGLASSQRPGGGCGTDTTVNAEVPVLHALMPEAPFCCTMRFAEGLWWAKTHAEELSAELTGELVQDKHGRWHDGDILYAAILAGAPADLPEKAAARVVGDLTLTPLVKYYRLPDEATAMALRQQVIFPVKKK